MVSLCDSVRPRFILAVLALLSVGAGGATAAGNPVRTLTAANQLESQVLVELNAIRAEHGLVPAAPLAPALDGGRLALARDGHLRILRPLLP